MANPIALDDDPNPRSFFRWPSPKQLVNDRERTVTTTHRPEQLQRIAKVHCGLRRDFTGAPLFRSLGLRVFLRLDRNHAVSHSCFFKWQTDDTCL
jgi:hypothetical protein